MLHPNLPAEAARAEIREMSFEDCGHELDTTPGCGLAAPESQSPDALLLVEEAKIGCTSAMLLCLDREQRLVPNRDGQSQETGLLKEWPKDGPRLVWQVKDLGG